MNNQTLTPEEISQWVIDNRYPRSENDKVSDAEMYHALRDKIESLLTQQENQENQQGQKELPTQEEFNKILDEAAFQTPYDGSNDFYDKNIVKHWNDCYNALNKEPNTSKENEPDIDWIPLRYDSDFAKLPKDQDFRCRFDDGSECNYWDEHTYAKMTHWKPLKSTIQPQEETKGIDPEIQDVVNENLWDLVTESAPKFNSKPCKNGCNCLDIAEYNNGGQGVMNYECLGKEQVEEKSDRQKRFCPRCQKQTIQTVRLYNTARRRDGYIWQCKICKENSAWAD